MRFRVEYAPRSTRDLAGIRAYIAKESESQQTADRFIARVLDACEALHTLPERFPRYPYARDWRMIPFGNYLVFFRIHEEAVRIGHIRHAPCPPQRQCTHSGQRLRSVEQRKSFLGFQTKRRQPCEL